VKTPFPAACGDPSYTATYDTIVEQILQQFRPDDILVSLGGDAHYRDPITSLVLSSPGYVDLLGRTAALATRICGSRFVVALEGGYPLEALSEVLAGVVGRMPGRSIGYTLTYVLDSGVHGRAALQARPRAQ